MNQENVIQREVFDFFEIFDIFDDMKLHRFLVLLSQRLNNM